MKWLLPHFLNSLEKVALAFVFLGSFMWTPFIFHITYATQGHGKLGVDPREQGMVHPGPWVQPIARQSHTHTHTHSRDGNQTPVM